MIRAIFNVIFTVAFSIAFSIGLFVGGYYVMESLMDMGEIPASYFSMAIPIFFHPAIFLGSMLLSKLILRIRQRGKYLLLALPIQYLNCAIVAGIGYLINYLLHFSMPESQLWLFFWSVPILNIVTIFFLDYISPTGPSSAYSYSKSVELKDVNMQKHSDLPAYYDGE